MFKLLKNSFNITNDSIILTAPLILFLSLLGLYINYIYDAADTTYKLFFSIVTFLVMLSGFLSAWLYMAKKTIAMTKHIFLFDKDRIKALIRLIFTLPKGIGRLLVPITSVIAIYIIMYLLMFSAFAFLITKIGKLSEYWDLMWVSGIVTLSFLTILWIPEIVYNEKNVIKALYNALIKLWQNIKNCLYLYLFISVFILLIIELYLVLIMHPIVSFFILMLFYYVLVYIVVLLFTYYEQTFIKG